MRPRESARFRELRSPQNGESADLAALQTATTLSADALALGSGFVIVQTSRHGARSSATGC